MSLSAITNCFIDASFVIRQASCANPEEPKGGSSGGALENCTVDSAVPSSLTSTWSELCASTNQVVDGYSIHKFTCVDEDIIGHEEMINETIIRADAR